MKKPSRFVEVDIYYPCYIITIFYFGLLYPIRAAGWRLAPDGTEKTGHPKCCASFSCYWNCGFVWGYSIIFLQQSWHVCYKLHNGFCNVLQEPWSVFRKNDVVWTNSDVRRLCHLTCIGLIRQLAHVDLASINGCGTITSIKWLTSIILVWLRLRLIHVLWSMNHIRLLPIGPFTTPYPLVSNQFR